MNLTWKYNFTKAFTTHCFSLKRKGIMLSREEVEMMIKQWAESYAEDNPMGVSDVFDCQRFVKKFTKGVKMDGKTF